VPGRPGTGTPQWGLATFAAGEVVTYDAGMRCIVTAGPTYEPLDNVRRLTNFSTGRLGSELANFLTDQGHNVLLLLGEQATYRVPKHTGSVEIFSTTTDLQDRLQSRAGTDVGAVFHAAAVSDFTFGQVWVRSPAGKLSPIKSGKISTRQGTLLAELLPTPKIITGLRSAFPRAFLAGWKFEVDGNRATVIAAAQKQVAECATDLCVANGPAFGPGFGLVRGGQECEPLPDTPALFHRLAQLLP
jgi:phosphopantothenoylcysteine synthetase/decarboxylase